MDAASPRPPAKPGNLIPKKSCLPFLVCRTRRLTWDFDRSMRDLLDQVRIMMVALLRGARRSTHVLILVGVALARPSDLLSDSKMDEAQAIRKI